MPFGIAAIVPDEKYTASNSTSVLLTIDAVLGGNGKAPINASLTAISNTSYGIVKVKAGHTLGLEAILMPDGTTPESNGFELVFDSGMQSPNLVPEPSTLAMITFGLLAFVIRRR